MDYATAPSLLMVGESTEARVAAEALGARVKTVPIEAAADEIGCHDALLLVADRENVALLERLVGERVIVVAPAELLDLVWGLAPDVHLLSAPTTFELTAALRDMFQPIAPSVAERRDQPGELLRLSAEVGRIAQALADLSTTPSPNVAVVPDAADIRAILRARRLRDRFFDAALFADPAWDMMLDLYAAHLEGGQVAVSSLCIAAAVPATTALRWIRGLTDAGIFVRVADPGDGRRFFIALAGSVRDGLAAYFVELRRLGLPGA